MPRHTRSWPPRREALCRFFAPEAEENLVALYEYIAEQGSPAVAAKYTEAIVTYCEGLGRLPHVGHQRNDIRPGLRISNYRRRAVVAFKVDDTARTVAILGVFYGGRDYERLLGDDTDEVFSEDD